MEHCGGDEGGKLYFLLLKLIKRKKSPVLGEVSQLILSPIEGTIRDNTAVWDQACAGGNISSESMEKKNDIATIYARP